MIILFILLLLFKSSETGKRMNDGMPLPGFALQKTVIREMMILETITLWTRQVPQVLTALLEDGVYHCREEYIRKKNDTISDYYLELYRWYTREARKYREIPPDTPYPIWLSVDEAMMLQPVENTVILKMEIPAEKVLLCNNDAWGYRVNYWYVPVNAEDADNHRTELARYGIHSDDELIKTHKGTFYPHLRKKIEKSWSRVFTQMNVGNDMLVATTWELRKEWIREVRIYEALYVTES